MHTAEAAKLHSCTITAEALTRTTADGLQNSYFNNMMQQQQKLQPEQMQ
jgi:hypothetical protein